MSLTKLLYATSALLGLILFLLLGAAAAYAGGPRFVTGTTGWWVGPGQVIVFGTTAPLYYTDPGALSTSTTHAQADAMVAAAAASWNVPVANITLAQGGSLNEHISSANAYFDGTEVVLPADASAANYLAKPIAVVYDTDGSVIDLLLGSGASSPSSCRQNGVVESVDGFGMMGTINHAIIVINGRCLGTGAALAPSLLQLQYQTMRAFGRVLGMAWAQVNDGVFTGATALNAGMIANWPVMHPLDVLCSAYTYQCMTDAFTLRADDLSALGQLYPIPDATPAGKTPRGAGAVNISGTLDFPTGQGMSMVNMAVTRQQYGTMDAYQVVSSVTGTKFATNTGNPVSGAETQADDIGDPRGPEGSMDLYRIPEDINANLWVSVESINPLYTGTYAIAPYQRPPVSLSGSVQNFVDWTAGIGSAVGFTGTQGDAASSCNPGADGSEAAPASFDPTGWRTGQFCGGLNHNSWFNVAIKAGHTWTIEATALNEAGSATDSKAQPVLGVWNAVDPTGTLPTVGAQAGAMNSMSLGTTQLRVGGPAADTTFRIVFSDQFGGSRPDFTYNGRVLYADAVSPNTAGSSGGQVTLTGTGFRLGNRVTVNGANATVVSWIANTIVLDVPTMAGAGATAGQAVSVSVIDGTTNGSTTIPNAFTYTAASDTLVQVSAPAQVITTTTAAMPFAVRVMTSDSLVGVPGAQVRFAVDPSSTGSVQLTACGAAACTLTADSTGLVQTTVTGIAAGSIKLTATEISGGATVSATLTDVDPVRSASIAQPTAWFAAGSSPTVTLTLTAVQNGAPGVGAPVTWTAANGLNLQSATSTANANGQASVTVTASSLPPGALTVTGCTWTTYCATWTLQSVDSSQWQVGVTSGAGQQIAGSASFSPITLNVTDGSAHPLQLAPITVYQRVEGYEGSCPATGRCPAAPTLATSQTGGATDSNGQLTVTPLTCGSGAQVVAISAAGGTQGFVTLTLVRTP